MRGIDFDRPRQFRVYPTLAIAAARKDKRMHRPLGVNDREPHVEVVRNILRGIDFMPVGRDLERSFATVPSAALAG
jgi:hypothetical protein